MSGGVRCAWSSDEKAAPVKSRDLVNSVVVRITLLPSRKKPSC